jgi:quinol monooxygenase YgiN
MSTITRIVRLSFAEENTKVFEAIFEATKNSIRTFEGCQHLELHRDVNHPNVYYTLSWWQSAESLEAYRQSDLFQTTWAKTKALFNAKAMAYSLSNIQSL